MFFFFYAEELWILLTECICVLLKALKVHVFFFLQKTELISCPSNWMCSMFTEEYDRNFCVLFCYSRLEKQSLFPDRNIQIK